MPHAPDLAGCALDGRYELHELIGEGTFGRVYRGYDRRLARPVAIKVIKPWWGEDPEWAESFEREAQMLARVSDPGIVQIFDVGQADEGLYYVTELVDGESLAARLRRGRLPPWEACEIAEQLCRALGHAHTEQVVHRDVKPANVLVSARGRVKVGDLGIARLAEGTTQGGTATMVGTPKYMAPEQANGLPATPATDVYSAGVVLYEMLAGRAPFRGGSPVEIALRHVQEPPPPLDLSVPRALARVVERALEKDPASRFASAVEMADALERARTSAGVGGRPDADLDPDPGRGGPGLGDADGRGLGLGAADGGGVGDADPNGLGLGDAGGDEDTTWIAPQFRARRTRHPDSTWIAPKMSPRRTVNPAARRRSVGVLALVLVVLVAMAVAPIVLSAHGTVRLPGLQGLSRAGAEAKLRHLGLRAAFGTRFSTARQGRVVAQTPPAGATVRDGSTVQVVLSGGPPPVPVPQVLGQSSDSAGNTLVHAGLRWNVEVVPAPGVAPGVVTRQWPPSGDRVRSGTTVTLFAAETPRWQPVTSFSGTGGGHSVPFRIRGSQWRIVYQMSYQGTCDFIFFCNGPSAQVIGLGATSTNTSFDLSDGGTKTRLFQSGPGLYQVNIRPGWDSAQWSVQVEDWF
jgi:eukaryotic-like serine/threonine-protein kinase